jgi:hypothetical protein
MSLIVDACTDCTTAERRRTCFRTYPNGESALLLADGSDTAFATGYQPIIDLVHESFALSSHSNAGSVQERLLLASASVEQAMFQRFPSSAQFGDEQYTATYIAVVVSGSQAFCAWIGSQQAKLFRSSRSVLETHPHVNIVPVRSRSDFIVTAKSLSTIPGQERSQADIEGPWTLQPGDVVVIADYRLFRLVSDDVVASIIATSHTSPARVLVERAESLEHSFAQSALVVRVAEG